MIHASDCSLESATNISANALEMIHQRRTALQIQLKSTSTGHVSVGALQISDASLALKNRKGLQIQLKSTGHVSVGALQISDASLAQKSR